MGFFQNITGGVANAISGVFQSGLDAVNPAASLPNDTTLNQSKYDFTYRIFPEDIAADDSFYNHYMIININTRTSTNYANYVTGPGPERQGRINTFRTLPNELSKTDALRFKIDPMFKNASGNALTLPFAVPRFSRRIVESICLYMPSSVVFTTQAEYENISLTGLVKSVVSSGLNGVGGFARGASMGGSSLGEQILTNAISGITNKAGQVAALGQMPFNPRVEVLYANTPQRGFQFDFLLAPSSEKESETIHQIYQTLRFHQAPEVNNGLYTLMWTAPSDFDITFYHRGQENTKLPRINTCVLETIDMNPAPTGTYSTFSNGHPVAWQMSLRFRELEILHKLRVLQGF